MAERDVPLLEVDDLTVGIGTTSVCERLALAIRPCSCWALLGRNGAGKTTLLHTLAGLRPATAGRIRLAGDALGELSRRAAALRVGLLPQDNRDPFPTGVLETALIGRHPHLRGLAVAGPADRALARAALAQVGLADFEKRSVTTLSGGERRRLALATLLVQEAPLALLDEPANHLDLRHQIELLGRVRDAQRARGGALLMVLHDVNLAARFCDHALLLYGNGAWEAGPCDEVLDEARLSRLYGFPVVRVDGPVGAAWLAGKSEW